MSESERPKCGGEALGDAPYDLPLHVAAVFIVFAASFLGVAFPVAAKKMPGLKIPPGVFFFCKHFGTGVLVATAFVHLLPVAFGSLTNECLPPLFTEVYPALPGVIMMVSMFLLFLIEMGLHTRGGHSHGGVTGREISEPITIHHHHSGGNGHGHGGFGHGQPEMYHSRNNSYNSQEHLEWVDEKRGLYSRKDENPFLDPPVFDMRGFEMPAWFVGFYNSYVQQINALQQKVASMTPASQGYERLDLGAKSKKGDTNVTVREVDAMSIDEEKRVDPAVLRKMNMDITLLEGGILFHSIFVGITISVTNEGFIILLVAILFHQAFEGLGLGSRIAAVPYPKKSFRPWALCIAFGTTCPIGQAIGLGIRNAYDPASAFALIMVGVFNAMSSGLLIYAALVDLLAQDFLGPDSYAEMKGKRTKAFIFVLLGALGMAIVGAFA